MVFRENWERRPPLRRVSRKNWGLKNWTIFGDAGTQNWTFAQKYEVRLCNILGHTTDVNPFFEHWL